MDLRVLISFPVLILGMCFLAGGLRFYQQDYDPSSSARLVVFAVTNAVICLAATIIHSSLLSIGVGAVCLPAAFHFALSYNADALGSGDTTMREQKVDLLMMSHSVSRAYSFVFSVLTAASQVSFLLLLSMFEHIGRITMLLTPLSLLRVSDLSALLAHAPVPGHREAEPEDPHRPFVAVCPIIHGTCAHEQREPTDAALKL